MTQIPTYQIDAFIPTTDNKRRINEKAPKFLELVESIRKYGVLEPILARPHPAQKGEYDLRAGERRWRAAKAAGLTEIPAIVRDMSDHEAVEITVIENLHREDLKPLEEAESLQVMLDNGWTIEQAANQIGRSQKWVARRAQLTKLAPLWKKMIENEKHHVSEWSVSHLELVAVLPADIQTQFAAEVNESYRWERTTLEDLKRYIGNRTQALAAARWKLDDATLVPSCGACNGCQKRTDVQPLLFDEEEPKGTKRATGALCLDPDCWNGKVTAWLQRKADELKAKHGQVVLAGSSYQDSPLGKPVDIHCLSECSKKTEGAIPALVVNGYGRNIGEIIWVKPEGKAAANAVGEDGKKQGKSMEQKREELERARVRLVLAKVVEALGEQDHTEFDAREVLALLNTFGTDYRHTEPVAYSINGKRNIEDIWQDAKTHTEGRLIALLHESVVPVVQSFCRGLIQSNDNQIARARWVCEVMKLDFADCFEQACTEKPEPKSWAKQAREEKAAKKGTRKAKTAVV